MIKPIICIRKKQMFCILILFFLSGCSGTTDKISTGETNKTPIIREHAQFLDNPYVETDIFVEKGKSIYHKHCIQCHGIEGEKPYYHSIKFHANRHQDGDYLWVITYGINNTDMPSFNSVLTIEERWMVLRYLKKELSWTLE
jgi:hypothetical protein